MDKADKKARQRVWRQAWREATPGNKTQDAPLKAGTTQWDGGGKHLPEKVGDKPFELVVVELKGKRGK